MTSLLNVRDISSTVHHFRDVTTQDVNEELKFMGKFKKKNFGGGGGGSGGQGFRLGVGLVGGSGLM